MALASPQGEPSHALSDDEFQRFAEFFYARTGIQFAASKRYFVDRRLLERIRKAGRADFRDYLDLIKSDGREYQALVNLMTVNETYFYRESYQLDCLVHSILPAVVPSLREKRLRIWSMPCSTGEEPYSIAFYLLEHWRLVDEYEIEIVASDIDTEALARAREGLYAPRAMQHVPKATLAKYTTDEGGGARRINRALRESIHFTCANLQELREDRQHRDFNVVFCRNLLIYFDDVSRREAANALFASMADGGFICLGHSESMSRMSSLFQLVKFPEAIVYRKPVR